MLKIKEIIIVEGIYDKIKLSTLVDATVIATDGFMIFKNKKMRDMIKRLADKNGAIIFTDSDKAGFTIRNYLKNILQGKNVKHAYIPDIPGKEKRKQRASKEGFLGVEGVRDEIILNALKNAGYEEKNDEEQRIITKSDLFLDGFSGTADSDYKRDLLKKKLKLPGRISANMLLDVLNKLYTYDEYKVFAKEIDEKCQKN